MSLFSHNKCGKITIKHWELDIFLFYILLIGGGVHYILTQRTPLPTGLHADGSSTRGGSTSVRGRVRSPHMAKLQAVSVPIA